jgi:hypothetical protein
MLRGISIEVEGGPIGAASETPMSTICVNGAVARKDLPPVGKKRYDIIQMAIVERVRSLAHGSRHKSKRRVQRGSI